MTITGPAEPRRGSGKGRRTRGRGEGGAGQADKARTSRKRKRREPERTRRLRFRLVGIRELLSVCLRGPLFRPGDGGAQQRRLAAELLLELVARRDQADLHLLLVVGEDVREFVVEERVAEPL